MLGVGDAGQRDVLGHDRRRECSVDAVGHLETGLAVVDLGGVLDGLLGLDGAEGHHLGDLVLTPAFRRVGDHLAATAIVEVDVDIRCGRALRVKETLEEQAVFHRVDVGDRQRVGHQGTGGGATARADADADGTGVLDDLGDDEKVRGVALQVDDFDLVLRALEVVLGDLGAVETLLQPALDLLRQPRGGGLSLRDVGDRHPVVRVRLPDLAVVLDALGDPQGVVAGVGHRVVEKIAHLFGRLDVVAGAVKFEAVLVQQGLARLHAQHRLMRLGLRLQHVVAVVGGQGRQLQHLADAQQIVAHALLDVQAVVHQLQEVIVLAVDVLPHRRGLQGLVELPQAQTGLDVAGRAAGGGDDAVGALRDQLRVHPRPLAQLALIRGHRRQVEQVAQAGGVFRQHRLVQIRAGRRDVVALLVGRAPADALFVEPRFRRHVGLDADDRLDPGLGHLAVKRVRPEHVAVVRDAHGGHTLTVNLVGEHVDLGHAVEHGIFGVVVQMHE